MLHSEHLFQPQDVKFFNYYFVNIIPRSPHFSYLRTQSRMDSSARGWPLGDPSPP